MLNRPQVTTLLFFSFLSFFGTQCRHFNLGGGVWGIIEDFLETKVCNIWFSLKVGIVLINVQIKSSFPWRI